MVKKIAVFLAVFAVFTAVETACARDLPDATAMIRRMNEKNRRLNVFTASLGVTVKTGGISVPLSGKLYFRRPDRTKIVFDYIPQALTGLNILPSASDLGGGKEENAKTVCREKRFGNDYYVTKAEKKEGDVEEVWMWINVKTLEPDLVYVKYRSGGSMEVKTDFLKTGEFMVPANQTILYRLPRYRATVTVNYRNYRFNDPGEAGI